MKKCLFAGLTIIFLISCAESKETKLQRFLLKGNLMMEDHNEEQAISYYLEALKLDPCFADALNNMGTIYFRKKRFDVALENYEKAVSCKADFLNGYFNRANTY